MAPRVLDGVLNVPKQARRVAALTLDADLAALAFDDQGSPVEQNQTIELCAIVVEADVSLGPGKEPAQIPNGQAIEGLCALLREAPTAGEQARLQEGIHVSAQGSREGEQVLALVLQERPVSQRVLVKEPAVRGRVQRSDCHRELIQDRFDVADIEGLVAPTDQIRRNRHRIADSLLVSGDHLHHRPAHRLTTLEFRQRLPPRRLGICRVRTGFPERIPSLRVELRHRLPDPDDIADREAEVLDQPGILAPVQLPGEIFSVARE